MRPSRRPPSGRYWSGSFQGSPGSGGTPSPSMLRRKGVRVVLSPSTPAAARRQSETRPWSSAWRCWKRRSEGKSRRNPGSRPWERSRPWGRARSNGAPPVSVLHIHGTEDDVILFQGDETEPVPASPSCLVQRSKQGKRRYGRGHLQHTPLSSTPHHEA